MTTSPQILHAMLAAIRSDLGAVSYSDLTPQGMAAEWIGTNVPDAVRTPPYDLTICAEARLDEAFAHAAPTALFLVECPLPAETDGSRRIAATTAETLPLERISIVRGTDTAWVLYARRPASDRPPVEVSVVIPARDQARALWRLLTVLAADDEAPPWELVILDRGSFDQTGTLLNAVQGELTIRTLSRETSLQESIAIGLEDCRAPIAVVLDPQVIPSAGWMRQVQASFADDAGLVLGAGVVSLPDADTSTKRDGSDVFSLRFFGLRMEAFHALPRVSFKERISILRSMDGAASTIPTLHARLLPGDATPPPA